MSTLKTIYKYLLHKRIIESIPIQAIQLPKLQKFVLKEFERYEFNIVVVNRGMNLFADPISLVIVERLSEIVHIREAVIP